MFIKEDWNTGKFGSIKKVIKFGLDKKNTSGYESIVSSLMISSENSPSYWINIAEELCRENLYWDAIDCWKHAAEISQEDKADILADMAKTLQQLNNKDLEEIAHQTYIEIAKIKPSPELWQYLATKTNKKNQILDYIEKALDFGEELRWDDIGIINIHNLSPNCTTDEVVNFIDLGDIYLWNNEISDAFRCYSKAMKSNSKEKPELLCSAIFHLNLYAHDKKYTIESFIPDNVYYNFSDGN
jgi:tetratricopeptide (TPR) repeat protein